MPEVPETVTKKENRFSAVYSFCVRYGSLLGLGACVAIGYLIVFVELHDHLFSTTNTRQLVFWAVKSIVFAACWGTCPLLIGTLLQKQKLLRILLLCGTTVFFLALSAVHLYYDYFGDLPHPAMLYERAAETLQIRNQIFMQLADLPLVFLLLLLGVSMFFAFRIATPESAQDRRPAIFLSLSILACGILFHALQVSRHPFHEDREFGYVRVAQNHGFAASFLLMMIPEDLSAIPLQSPPGPINLPTEHPSVLLGNETNVLVLQIESWDRSLVGLKVDNKEITPNLNRLVTEGVYCSNYIAQHAGGGTSDAELSTLLSQIPLANRSGLRTAKYGEITSLPDHLTKWGGHHAVAMHPNVSSFFHRRHAFSGMGFEEFHHAESFHGNARGLHAKDDAFFQQSLALLEATPSPFFCYLITIQSHGPFRNLADNTFRKELNSGKEAGTHPEIVLDYFAVMHEVDTAVGRLLDDLKEKRLKDKTLIVIASDHTSGVFDTRTTHEHVPLLFLHPILPPEVIRAPCSPLDIAPTICALLGTPPAESWLGSAIIPAAPGRRVLLPPFHQLQLEDGKLIVTPCPTSDRKYFDYSKYLLSK